MNLGHCSSAGVILILESLVPLSAIGVLQATDGTEGTLNAAASLGSVLRKWNGSKTPLCFVGFAVEI